MALSDAQCVPAARAGDSGPGAHTAGIGYAFIGDGPEQRALDRALTWAMIYAALDD